MFTIINKIVTRFQDLEKGDHFMLSDDSSSVRVKRSEVIHETKPKNSVSLRRGSLYFVEADTPVIRVNTEVTVTEAK